ncbi:hypothetical protein LIPSTDRAFT_66866, partial [Lipomyces starkeyi NRRL Y-11557]
MLTSCMLKHHDQTTWSCTLQPSLPYYQDSENCNVGSRGVSVKKDDILVQIDSQKSYDMACPTHKSPRS